MNFSDYQKQARRTARHGPHADLNYALGLAGETGELIELVKKCAFHGKEIRTEDVQKEAGDVLWYLANLCAEFGIDLEDVAQANIEKLQRRYPDGFMDGGGVR
ncbi:MAG: nucleoside triphosphate pyrophosphohydrolase family protein [Planctomycetota bacterium]